MVDVASLYFSAQQTSEITIAVFGNSALPSAQSVKYASDRLAGKISGNMSKFQVFKRYLFSFLVAETTNADIGKSNNFLAASIEKVIMTSDYPRSFIIFDVVFFTLRLIMC